MKVIRWLLGRIILLINFIFSPRGIKREPEQQAKFDQLCKSLSLYQFAACPFCVKVRRAMKRNSLNIECRDAQKEGPDRQALLEQGGRIKVPCLRIENNDGTVTWLYESSDIVEYLNQLSV